MVSGKRPQFNLMVDPYTEQMLRYGVGGAPMTNLEAVRARKTPTFKDDPKTLMDNLFKGGFFGLGDVFEAGGPGFASMPYKPPKNVQEATKQITGKNDNIFQVPGEELNTKSAFEINKALSENFVPKKDRLNYKKPETLDSDSALAQNIPIEEIERSKKAEEFRAQEAKIAEAQGMPQENLVGEGGEKDGEKAIEKLFEQSMEDYITNARGVGPEKRTKDLAEYKREFAEATGIDISGKVDKSAALMSLGLALMQNRAGKGFNVGRMLSEFGKAGEAAMPALEKAKTQARNDAIAAGKYALQTRASDRATDAANQEKLMDRQQYYVYRSGGKGAPYENFDDGDLVHLNKFELNKLIQDGNFDKEFSFIKAKDYFDIMKAESKETDLGNAYGKEKSVSLLGGETDGVDSIYVVNAQLPDGNYKGKKKNFGYLQTNENVVKKNFIEEQNSILREEDKFKGLVGQIQTGVSIPKQLASSVIQFGRNLGLDIGDGPTAIAQARKKLEAIQLQEATEILQESGKTLSDTDRERVKAFVGEIDLANADEALIMQSLGRVYELILTSRQRNLDTAVDNLYSNFGIKIDFGTDSDDIPKNKEELDAMNKKFGTNYTMDDYKK